VNIDELVVTLSLDPSNFTEGQRKALDSFKKTDDEMQKRLKSLEATNKNVGYSFDDVSHAATGLASVIIGTGMASFARDTMTSVAATGRLAHNIGEATGELSTFGRMIERNGGNADAAIGSLKGFSDQITRLNTLGQGSPELFSFLGTIGGQADEGPLATFMRFAEWAEKHKDNPQLVNLIGGQGGFDQGTINEAMKGRVQVLKDFAAASRGAISPEQVEALTKLQGAWVSLDQAIEKTGRDIVTFFAPAFTSIAGSTAGWIERNQKLADSLGGILAALAGLSALKPAAWLLRLLGLGGVAGAVGGAAALPGKLIKGGGIGGAALGVAETMKYDSQHGNELRTWLRAQLGIDDPGEAAPWAGSQVNPGTMNMERRAWGYADDGPEGVDPKASGGRDPAAEREKRIRSIAKSLNIDPEVAMRVARSEGFDHFKSTIPGEQSFSDFQLHVTPGGRGHAVGDEFRRQTGLDPSNPANEAAADLFALQHVARHGWHDFHGADRVGIGDHQGIGDVHIDQIVVHTDSKDPREHGRLVGEAIKRNSSTATQANTGLN
jgi:hypothetical protein